MRKQKPKQKKPKNPTQESASSSDSGSDSSSSGSDSSSSGSDSAALKKKLPVKKRPVKQGVKRPLETSEAPDPKKAC